MPLVKPGAFAGAHSGSGIQGVRAAGCSQEFEPHLTGPIDAYSTIPQALVTPAAEEPYCDITRTREILIAGLACRR